MAQVIEVLVDGTVVVVSKLEGLREWVWLGPVLRVRV